MKDYCYDNIDMRNSARKDGFIQKLLGLFGKRHYYLYIATNQKRSMLLSGITTLSLNATIKQWQTMQEQMADLPGSQYLCVHLLYWESFSSIADAMKRKKEMELRRSDQFFSTG